MERLDMFKKSTFDLLIIFIVFLISGCINSNKEISEPQQTINLHANQIILDDAEIKEVLGNDWEMKDMLVDNSTKKGDFVLSSDIIKGYDNPNITSMKSFRNKIQITVYVSPNISSSDANYQLFLSKFPIEYVVSKKFDIGDYGEIYTFVGLQEGLNGQTVLVFKKNNIIISIYAIPEINIDTVSRLANKQDEKIQGFLKR